MKIKVSDFIADFFVSKGVEHIFTITGGGAMHLNDSFGHHSNLTCIYNHHEQGSAIAAEGYTRFSGKIAPICVTSGPGGTNTLTGVLGGWLDSIPMFIISGQVKRETTIWSTDVPLRQLGDQEFNIVDCVQSMTKYAYMITDPLDIKYHLEKAWFLCQNGRGGPVWLDIPLDIQAALIELDDLIGFDCSEVDKKENPQYDETLTGVIVEKLKRAARPVILAGSGVRLSGSYVEFLELIEKLNIPVVTAWNSHDLLWDEHQVFCGRPGTVGTRGGNFIVENSDVLFVLGSRLNIRQISYNYKTYAQHAYKIIVDIDENELKKPTISPDLPIHANVKDVISNLNGVVRTEDFTHHQEWLSWCREVNAKYPAVLPSYYLKKAPINPYVFIDELFDKLVEDECIIAGNGTACVVTFQAAKIKKGQRLFTNSGCASMGYGFPAALGAAVAQKGKRVICLDGDGSFQMNIQELQTVVYNQLNMKIIILNNNGYHSIRQTQNNLFKPPLIGVSEGNGLSFPNLEKLAYAYDVPYVRVDQVDGAAEALSTFLSYEGPVICEVMLDSEQNFEPKLSSKVLPDGKIVSPPIDDMFPFLSREEYESNKFR
ncbi:thiamine pyrophosphate-binding protein [Paenibacillus silvae]|uniref:thiamine pyrophosphate-binding protein n=1 Tax=Paenibacillus silvae TaxID=1325358 RepID=UPI0025A09407|nr:thiamine pyrophosphate-binding protein [Paenibacillus silvae]MDM5281346.1 thiamine pyrophosphate-binding protein [Paenibacillus silvae]